MAAAVRNRCSTQSVQPTFRCRCDAPGAAIGAGNTALGQAAGATISTGTDNVCLGRGADVGAALTNAISLGAGVSATVSNSLNLPAVENVGGAGAAGNFLVVYLNGVRMKIQLYADA